MLSLIATKVSGRFYLANKAFELYGVKLIGQSVEWNSTLGQAYLVADSSYVRNMIEYGWIAYGICIAGYVYTIKKLLDIKQYGFLIGIILILIYSNMEIILLAFGINPFLVIFGPLLFGSTTQDRTEV